MAAHTVRLGLTGGIGSGKSTVAKFMASHGAAVVDADAIAHALTAPDGRAIPAIMDGFGADFIKPNGALDRDKMRSLIHAEASARHRLESIIHPLVGVQTEKEAESARQSGYRCIVFDVPLLAESRVWRTKVDLVLVVDCTPDIQISRVMARSQLTRLEVERILSSQAGREYRLRAADAVIFNANLSLECLADEVAQISHRLGLSSV